jgi:outer membrane protein OmpA-like peptidoglycan-associated protein
LKPGGCEIFCRRSERGIHPQFNLVAKKSQIELISAKVIVYMRPMNRSATMKRQILAASLAALAVFCAPVSAQDNNGEVKAEQDGAGPAVIRQIQRFLSADVDLRRLPAPELLQRYKLATEYASQDGLPNNMKTELQRSAQASRNELNRRKAAAGNAPDPQATTKRRATGAEQPADVAVGDEPVASPNRKTGAEDVPVREVEVAPARPRKPAVVVERVVSADERDAQRFMLDARPAKSLGDVELRKRLTAGRNILQSGRLSDQTKRRVARTVEADRVVVRDRQAARNQDAEKRRIQEARAQGKDNNRPKFNVDINIDLRPNSVVLRDRRRSDELTDAELQQRIRIYRDIESERDYQSYQESERRYWREQMALDRQYMRRRLLDDRRRRDDVELPRGREIVINVQPEASDEIDVFAAEADENQIEEVLVAAPRVRVERRYNVEEVANDANIRRSMPRVEVDTIRFGNNEAIVREEEVGKLDRIGAVLERILRGHPREVFMIEGHTDAVGSDVYNLGLSRARAEAVKVALTTYYNIPAQNLRTVGLGERFLKVPTYESEPENRRVSIGRITAFVGENG